MSYSRKGLWLARGAMFLLVVVSVCYARTMRPSRDIIAWGGVAFMVAAFALAFRAYFYLDEIQRITRMRAWYYGTALGIFVSFIAILCLRARPDLLNAAMDGALGHHSLPPLVYFSAGVMFILLAQVAGNYVVRAFLALPKRNP